MIYKPEINWNDARRDLRCAGIYLIKNITNDDCYVGQSQDIWKRWSRHLNNLKKDKHENKHLQRAFSLHDGLKNFEFAVLCYCEVADCEILDAHENFFIGFYAQHGKTYPAYNNRPDAKSSRGVRSAMKGKHYPPEVRARVDEANRNKAPWSFSPEELKKRADRMRANPPLKNPEVAAKVVKTRRENGSYKTEERIAYQKRLSEEKKIPVERIDVKTGEVRWYASTADASLDGPSSGSILRCLKGVCISSNGCVWKYANEKRTVCCGDELLKIQSVVALRAPGQKQPIERINLETGEIKEYSSINGAAAENQIDVKNIKKCLNGNLQEYAGFGWQKLNSIN